MAQIELEELKATLQHVRFLDRKNKEDTKTSLLELKFTTRVGGDFLANFHPSLRSTFYTLDDSDAALDSEQRPTKRVFGDSISQIKWMDKLEGAYVTIDHGVSSKMEVELATVGPWTLQIMEGGTCQLTFPVRAEFSSKEVKTIAELIKAEVVIDAAMAQGQLIED